MVRVALLLVLIRYGWCSLSALGPRFTLEPAARVRYGAGAGARVRCAAAGAPPPQLAWLAADGAELRDEPGIRRVYSNGTLELLPSPGRDRAAPATVRCRAANAHGTALSRDVTLEPVADAEWEPVLTAGAAAPGGVAALACRAAPADAPLERILWYRGDRLINVDAPTPDSRYIVAGDTLLVRDAAAADAGPYACLARHAITSVTKRSQPAHLSVTSTSGRSAPRLGSAPSEATAAAGETVCLPCVAADHPPPHYTWYREREGRLQPVGGAGSAGGEWLWAGGAALCVRAAAGGGAWLCKAHNALGDATRQLRLDVADALTVTVTPDVTVADAGSTVRLNCSASVAGAALEWMHDARALGAAGAGGALVLRDVTRASQGVYQCRARSNARTAQATAEIRLGDSPPELTYTFIEQALRAGGDVSLRCAAGGAPPPRLAWLLDDTPLDQYHTQHRYLISSETTARGDVVSTLNISAAAAPDGGRYTCRASNHLGDAEHSARLNIYGPVSIRALGPLRVVAGDNVTVHCPYAGYPISSIAWWRRGDGAALGGAGRVAARGAALRLAPALASDAGHYACAVAAPAGAQARRDIEIQVRNPPKISPFMFSSELTEGSSAQVLCGVSSGDKPMYFSWVKDGAPLPSTLQIEEKSLNEFSLLMFSDLTARHSGEYTCRVSNHAATVNYTATLSVKVAPAWVTEPLDAAVLLGASILLECAAKGYPTPTVTWYRKIGEGGLGPESEQWEQVGGAWGGSAGSAVGGGLEVLMREGESGVRVRDGALAAASAARRHQGVYRCTADNGVGPPLVKHVNLTIHEPANFESSAGNVSCVRGRSASLSCHALGDAPLAVHWSHRGATLDLNSYRWTVSEVRTSDGIRSTLQLRAAESGDAGEYRCHAHNQYGRSEVLIFLHVEEPPEAPSGVRLGGVGSRWVRVQWRAAGGGRGGGGEHYSALCTALHSLPGAEPPHTIFNLTLESNGDSSPDADRPRPLAARLEGLRPAAAYSLRVVAGNRVGRSPHSEPLTFTTLEEAPAAPPRNVRVRPDGAGELHVSWSAPVRDSWNGELLGYAATWRALGRLADADESARAGRLAARGWSSTALSLAGLAAAARYAVSVRAYNRAGVGPASPAVYATTAEGVPEVPPESVTCEALSSRSLRVRWTQTPGSTHALRGYDVHYAPLQLSAPWSDSAESQAVRSGAAGEATLQGLAAATNYSVWVRARADAGPGPCSAPVYCLTDDDAPGAVTSLRALPAGADALRVTWLPPARAPRLAHYTLYAKELGESAAGGARAQRVEGGAPGEEVRRELRGLRAARYALWVVAGAGPASRAVSAAPAEPGPARVSSLPRAVLVSRGARVRLRCAALGTPPIRRRWSPLPPAHSVTDDGDLIVHDAEPALSGNYTCSVRNAGGADAVSHSLLVVAPPPAPPAPHLLSAAPHALRLAWDAPAPAREPAPPLAILGYTAHWERWEGPDGAGGAGGAGRAWLPRGERALWLRRLPCGARYRVWLRAHNAAGASPRSAPLAARTEGDKAVPAPGAEFVWANSSALRLNLLAWRSRCAAPSFRVALRPASPASPASPAPRDWTPLDNDGEKAEVGDLSPGTWYEVRVVARSPAGDSVALYRAATRTLSGERIGEAVEVAIEVRSSRTDGVGPVAGGGGWGGGWGEGGGGGAAPALCGAALAALLATLAGLILARRRRAPWCGRRERAPIYSAEPAERNGKELAPPEGDLNEISPYATFIMSGGGEGAGACAGAACPPPAPRPSGGGGGGGGCALHLRTFGRAQSLDLAAPPPRPNLLSHPEYGRARDSDSESSGSPCAACALEPRRAPAARRPDSLPCAESSAEEAYGTAAARGGSGGRSGCRGGRAPRRRRDPPARHPPPPGAGLRYLSPVGAHARQEAL